MQKPHISIWKYVGKSENFMRVAFSVVNLWLFNLTLRWYFPQTHTKSESEFSFSENVCVRDLCVCVCVVKDATDKLGDIFKGVVFSARQCGQLVCYWEVVGLCRIPSVSFLVAFGFGILDCLFGSGWFELGWHRACSFSMSMLVWICVFLVFAGLYQENVSWFSGWVFCGWDRSESAFTLSLWVLWVSYYVWFISGENHDDSHVERMSFPKTQILPKSQSLSQPTP